MSKDYKEIQMLKLNEYAHEYIENYDNNIDYQKITEQMKEFSGAEYVMFNIFDENGKDFTLVGLDGNGEEMLKIFATQVGLYIDKKNSEQKTLKSIKRFQALLENSVSIITIVDDKGYYVDLSDSAAN
jgi:PAS domain-containing protein